MTFLLLSGVVGATLTLTTLYSTSYAVTVDGEPVGVVADQSVVDRAIQTVEAQGTRLLGYDYQVDGQVDYDFTLTLKSELSDQRAIQNYFYEQLDEVSDQVKSYEVTVDGRSVGVIKDESTLDRLLTELRDQYTTENTVQVGFVENLQVHDVYAVEDQMTAEEMRQALTANTTGDTTYTVQRGDTFNAIAYANDMSVSDLTALNPGVDINRLMVGDVLNVKELIPLLSVRTLDHEVYSQPSSARWRRWRTAPCTRGTPRSSPRGRRARPGWRPTWSM